MAFTEEQLKEAARKAYAAGDTAAAKRLIEAAKAAAIPTAAIQPSAPPAPDTSTATTVTAVAPQPIVSPTQPSTTTGQPSALEQYKQRGFTTSVATYNDGQILENSATGERAFVSPGYVTQDQKVIAGMMAGISPAETQSAQMQNPKDAPSFWETAYENVIGSGAIDTPGERIGSVIKAGGAGLVRGAAELVGLPGTVGRYTDIGLKKIGLLPENEPESPVFSALSGEGIRSGLSYITGGATEYRDPSMVGKLAGTTGEMVGGGAGLKVGAMAAAGSEALGSLTEGSVVEPYARMVGAFFTPVLMPKLAQSVKSAFSSAAARPSVQTLRDAKNVAYGAVDSAGIKIPASSMDDLANRSVAAARNNNYVSEVDSQTKAALSIFDNKRGQELTLGELDRIRQGLWARLKTSPNENALRQMIDDIDETIQSIPLGGDLMDAARLANSRYKKSELLDDAFKKAELQTASTGSGGNIVNKFRQAVTSIVTNKDKAKFFSEQELGFMRAFVKGTNAENALRLVGKISPSGNGLMQVLNIGAIAYNPYLAGITLAGFGAKALSERSALKGASTLQDIIASGQVPTARPSVMAPIAARVAPGIMANEKASPQ
jgi:hypothetical protein